MRVKGFFAAVGAASLMLIGQLAHAACNLIATPTQTQLTEWGDTALASTHCIGPLLTVPSVTKRHIDNLGLAKSAWDEGWGWADECNKTLPMGRALNAMQLLYTGMPGSPPAASDMSGNLLRHGYNFANRAIDATGTDCTTENTAKYFDILGNGLVGLYAPYFNISAVERAGVLVHEARHETHAHLTHRSRNGGFCGFRPITSCDLRWGTGAFTYEVTWLWWFAVEGDNVTTIMRRQAVDIATWLANSAFDEKSNIVPWCNC